MHNAEKIITANLTIDFQARIMYNMYIENIQTQKKKSGIFNTAEDLHCSNAAVNSGPEMVSVLKVIESFPLCQTMSSQNLPLQEKSAESQAKLLIIALFLARAGSGVTKKWQSRRLCADGPASAME